MSLIKLYFSLNIHVSGCDIFIIIMYNIVLLFFLTLIFILD